MFKGDVDEKLSLISVIIGLISGLLLFPNQTFDKSILIGNIEIVNKELIPVNGSNKRVKNK